MTQATFVIAYGDNLLNGRGIHAVDVDAGHLTSSLVYAMESKPGAMIVLGDKAFLSYRNDASSGILTFLINDDSTLTLQRDDIIPYFISVFSWNAENQLLLGCSFHDAVDVIFSLDSGLSISDVMQHAYRVRSDDARQTQAHPHNIGLLPSAGFGYSVDLGTDLIVRFGIQNGRFSDVDAQWEDRPLGSGPRIIRPHPNGRFLYLLNEIANSITVFDMDSDGQLTEIQTLSTLDDDSLLSSAAGIQLTHDGKHLLVSNRGEDSLVLFGIDQTSGRLTVLDRVPTGQTPRDIALLDDGGILVASQDSNCVQYFCVNDHQLLEFKDEVSHILSPVVFAEV